MAMPRTVVLVHGAWHGAWCWTRVEDGLSKAGVPSVAVDLPGHGADTGPLGDLHTDSARVRQALDGLPGPAVLVGHSYGGAVITEAGEHPAVEHLVYLAALAVDGDETCMSAATGEAAAVTLDQSGRPDLAGGFVVSDDGSSITVDPAVATAALYNGCSEADAAWALGQLGPQPMATFGQTPTAVAWRTRPSTYVVCADDMAIHPDLQRVLAKRCTTTIEWDSDHSPFLSHPDLVVDLLAGLSRT
jgi:pimeloyl-ACP methyl ester carboxylesterase